MRLHLVVNPEGGLKKGISILKEVKPLFKKASIEERKIELLSMKNAELRKLLKGVKRL